MSLHPSPLPSLGLMSVPDKGTVLLSSPPHPPPNHSQHRDPKAGASGLRSEMRKPSLGQQVLNAGRKAKGPFPLLVGVGSGVADGLGQPGACCPGNSPAPPLLIGCHGGSQPRFKGTPVIALLKTYQSHCGWRNKRSFSSSPSLFLPRWRGERVALFLGALGLPHRGACNKMTTRGALPPLSLGQLEMQRQGPQNSLVLGQARGVMEAEADPSLPSPTKSAGESSILSGHQCTKCSPA